MMTFQGIYTPIITPFTSGEELDWDSLLHDLGKWNESPLDGVVTMGSNGEFVHLDELEKHEVTKFARQHLAPGKKLIAGASCNSTRGTIALCRQMADLGADAVLLLPPHYYRGGMNEEVLLRYFTDAADASPVPVMLYNMPGNTGVNLSSGLVAKLARHENIVGIKDTSGNIVQIAEIVRDTDADFAVFAGNASYLLPALAVGARGATLALANVLPEDCCTLVSLFRAGKTVEAQALQLALMEVNAAVTTRFGISGLKYAMTALGYRGGEVRRPLRPLNDAQQAEVSRILSEFLAKYPR